MISAVNCRPWNGFLLPCFTVSPSQPPPVVAQAEQASKLQQNPCLPYSQTLRPALPKIGTCPSGYHSSGDYCLGYENAKHAIPKTGSCPSGYHSSGNYCLS